jgi:hypothetical protein
VKLGDLKRRARVYVEQQAHAKVLCVAFARRFVLFGREDVALSVDIDDPSDPSWWVIGGTTPMNLYSKKSFPEAGMAFTLHTGITMQLLDREYSASATPPRQIGYDAFISHASEDKHRLVQPLARELTRNGLRVWYDEFEVRVGDSLRQSIDRGLATSSYGIVVLSPAFFGKRWPEYELNGLVAREIGGRASILPVWHRVDRDDVMEYSPTLADRMAVSTRGRSIRAVANALRRAMEA